MSTRRRRSVSIDCAYWPSRNAKRSDWSLKSRLSTSRRFWWSARSASSVWRRSETSPTFDSSARMREVYPATSARRLSSCRLCAASRPWSDVIFASTWCFFVTSSPSAGVASRSRTTSASVSRRIPGRLRRAAHLLLRQARGRSLVRRRIRLGHRGGYRRRALVRRRGRLRRQLGSLECGHLGTVARLPVERPQRVRSRLPEWADVAPVVVVGDLAGAVVELELLERS